MAATTTRNTVYCATQGDNDANGRVIQGFLFKGASAGNACVIKEGSDGSGEVIFSATVSANGETVAIGGLQLGVDGFQVTTLTAGDSVVVYVA